MSETNRSFMIHIQVSIITNNNMNNNHNNNNNTHSTRHKKSQYLEQQQKCQSSKRDRFSHIRSHVIFNIITG